MSSMILLPEFDIKSQKCTSSVKHATFHCRVSKYFCNMSSYLTITWIVKIKKQWKSKNNDNCVTKGLVVHEKRIRGDTDMLEVRVKCPERKRRSKRPRISILKQRFLITWWFCLPWHKNNAPSARARISIRCKTRKSVFKCTFFSFNPKTNPQIKQSVHSLIRVVYVERVKNLRWPSRSYCIALWQWLQSDRVQKLSSNYTKTTRIFKADSCYSTFTHKHFTIKRNKKVQRGNMFVNFNKRHYFLTRNACFFNRAMLAAPWKHVFLFIWNSNICAHVSEIRAP